MSLASCRRPVHFLIFERQHGQRDAFGLASCRHTALNAGPLVAVRVLMGTASPGARAFRAPERHTASGLRVRRCVELSGVTVLTGATGWRVTLPAITRPTVATEICCRQVIKDRTLWVFLIT